MVPTLVNKCRIYDEDWMAYYAHYKSISERKGKNQYNGKAYSAPADKGKQRAEYEKNQYMSSASSVVS